MTIPQFADLALSEPVLRALADVGYESPSPIQAATIPVLLAGRDMLGQAQTGTGKTAAFALPVLTRLDLASRDTQVLVLAPTRELAIQVAEAFQRYAAHMKSFHVLPIYGGQSYGPQLASLRRGAHVVVGTPGRVMDHMKRETLQLGKLTTLVLDEADEMLRMGFIDDVEWILEKTPPQRQVALFSATHADADPPHRRALPARRAEGDDRQQDLHRDQHPPALLDGQRHAQARCADPHPRGRAVRRHAGVRAHQAGHRRARREAARRAASPPRRSTATSRRRCANAPSQRLKSGELDILVATDVAARGLDVERISHVVNYDVPSDTESYVHRIGRTGRAGRSGEAILFVAPRERGLLARDRARDAPEDRADGPAERAGGQRAARRQVQAAGAGCARPRATRRPIARSSNRSNASRACPRPTSPPRSRACCAARRRCCSPPATRRARSGTASSATATPGRAATSSAVAATDVPATRAPGGHADVPAPAHFDRPGPRRARGDEPEMETFRVEVGHDHGVKPGNIVGALANEAGLDGRDIGRIDVRSDHSLVDLPGGMPKEIFKQLQTVRVVGQELRISRLAPRPFQKKPHRGQKPGTSRKRRGPRS